MKPRYNYKKKIFNKEKLSLWAKKIKARDCYSCKACGSKGYLHSHHILPKSRFSQYAYEVWNGVTLCKKCHLGSQGVHGSKRPRNKIVSKLRSFMRTGSVSDVKNFTSLFKDSRKITVKPPPFKKKVKYTMYKRYKRKLY